jgi:hypothetical protein
VSTTAGASQIVFVTDFPFVSAARTLVGLKKCGFAEEERRGIDRDTP